MSDYVHNRRTKCKKIFSTNFFFRISCYAFFDILYTPVITNKPALPAGVAKRSLYFYFFKMFPKKSYCICWAVTRQNLKYEENTFMNSVYFGCALCMLVPSVHARNFPRMDLIMFVWLSLSLV